MFYKYDAALDEWMVGDTVDFPDGEQLNIDNKGPRDGFTWHDDPPQAYLDWCAVNIENTL